MSPIFSVRILWPALACLLSLSLMACDDATDDGDGAGNNNAGNNSAGNNTQNNTANNTVGGPTIEITGSYDDNFGGMLVIQDGMWITAYPKAEGDGVDEYPSTITTFDNATNTAITLNPPDAEFNPGQYNKNVWTEPDADGAFFYCTVVFGLESEQAALDDPTVADDTDPQTEGCGSAPWTMVTAQ